MVCSFVLNCKQNRGIAQLVARLSGGQEVVSSSLATPTRKTTNFDRNLSFFSYIRLAASDMRKRVIFASQVICASRVEDYKANIISL